VFLIGKDIHMFIVNHQKEILKKEIFDGRNYEWFNQLCGGGDERYDELPIVFGWSPFTPVSFKKKYSNENYFDFYHMKVKFFISWFEKARPDIDAGWVRTYEKWLYENKGIIPEIQHYLYPEENFILQDWHFITIEKHDCFKWLYDYLIENDIDKNADITYCFDC